MEMRVQDPANDFLRRIKEISLRCERIERAVEALVQCHGDRSQTVDAARALQVSVTVLKRELQQRYLEYLAADAARMSGVSERLNQKHRVAKSGHQG